MNSELLQWPDAAVEPTAGDAAYGTKVEGLQMAGGVFSAKKKQYTVFTRTSSWTSVNIVSSVPLFLWRNGVSFLIAWSRLLLNAISLKEWMYDVQTSSSEGLRNIKMLLNSQRAFIMKSWNAVSAVNSETGRCVSNFRPQHVRACICLCSHQSSFGN